MTKEKLKNFRDKKSTLNSKFIRFSLEYANKISGIEIDDVVISLRNSLLFRLDALIFHYEYLINHKEHYLSIIDQKKGMDKFDHDIASNATRIQTFIFDDIIFNSVSVFDYLGYFMSVLTYGIHKKWTWNKLYRASKDHKSKISNSIFKDNLVKVHSEFIEHIYQFRSELIHYQTYGVGYKLIYSGYSGVKLTLHPPKDFLKVLRQAKLIENENDELIFVKSIEIFLSHCFEVVSDIMDLSFKHLEDSRKRSEDEQIYFFGNPDDI